MTKVTNISPQNIEERSLQHHEPHWLRQGRLQAWDTYQRLGYPDWRKAKMSKVDLEQDTVLDWSDEEMIPLKIEKKAPEGCAGKILFHNNEVARISLNKELANKGVIFCDTKTAILERADLLERYYQPNAKSDKFSAFHQALAENGFFLYIPAGLTIDEPFQVEVVQKNNSSVLLNSFIIVDQGSEITLEEYFHSEDKATRTVVCSHTTSITLEEGAKVKSISIQDWGKEVYDLAEHRLNAKKNAHLRALFLLLGGQSGRTIIQGDATEPGANIEHDGIIIGTDEQRFKIIAEMKQSANHTEGLMKYKGILKDKAYSSLDGLITMLPTAQKSNARLEEHTLLLSDKARCDALPALDIRASDVRVSHSASVSQADREKIFYLMSRGLSAEEARNLIIQGFFENLLELIPDPRAYEKTKELIDAKLLTAKL